jgi:hypothetical protein
MNLTSQFEEILGKKDNDTMFKWIMEKLLLNPDSVELRGMAAFAFLVLDKTWVAREMAETVLKENPDETWSLAALFGSYRYDDVTRNARFFEDEFFKLGPEWIPRFAKAFHDQTAEKLIYCLTLYGTPAQKFLLLENYLVTPADPPLGQLSLPIENLPKEQKKRK